MQKHDLTGRAPCPWCGARPEPCEGSYKWVHVTPTCPGLLRANQIRPGDKP
jgi:hypothetical protein